MLLERSRTHNKGRLTKFGGDLTSHANDRREFNLFAFVLFLFVSVTLSHQSTEWPVRPIASSFKS